MCPNDKELDTKNYLFLFRHALLTFLQTYIIS
jgi:hypothetical protein